jgi:Protein of unknown function
MNKAQAAEIQKHMLEAAQAIRRAEAAISVLEREDRVMLIPPLAEIVVSQMKLMNVIYVRYPELRPPPTDLPTISSVLRWDDVALPDAISEADLDAVIFSALRSQWRKTAMVVGTAFTRCQELLLPVSAEIIGARIEALAESDRIEGAGDLRKWRHSEVRLKR